MSSDSGLRIVLCAPGFPVSPDDADKPFLLDHACALSKAGIQVTVVCPAVPGAQSQQIIQQIKIIRVRYAPRRFETLASTGSMYRAARTWKGVWAIPMIVSMILETVRQVRLRSAIIYGHWWLPGGLVAVVAGKLTRQPSLVHFHGSDAAITQNAALRFLARAVARLADVRLAVSDSLAAWVGDLSGTPVKTMPMPVSLAVEGQLSEAPDDGYILAVGRLVPEKGFDVLIDAVGLLTETQRREIAIVGVGPQRQALAERARRAGVTLHLPGAVPHGELADWYRNARMVVVPSRREGFGLVAAEAAAMGRTVIGTRVGGIPTVVNDGVSGVLIEPDDVEGLKDALSKADPNMGVFGPALVTQLGVEHHGKRLRQICEDLLN